MIGAVNGDFSGLESTQRMEKIIAGLEALGPHLVKCDDSTDFSLRPCDCCHTRLHGDRYEFAILG
jgi:hypothetical protein